MLVSMAVQGIAVKYCNFTGFIVNKLIYSRGSAVTISRAYG